MTQSWELNIFLTCHSSTKKGSEKFRARGNTGADCPDEGVWRDKCDNHTFESSKGLGAFTTGCVHTGAEGWPHPSGEAALCEALRLQTPLGSAFPVGCPLQWGLEGSEGGKATEGPWGHEQSVGREQWESQQSQVFALQGALLVQWHKGFFLLTNSTMKWSLLEEISRCSWCQLKRNDYNDAGGTETLFQLMQERNNLFSA